MDFEKSIDNEDKRNIDNSDENIFADQIDLSRSPINYGPLIDETPVQGDLGDHQDNGVVRGAEPCSFNEEEQKSFTVDLEEVLEDHEESSNILQSEKLKFVSLKQFRGSQDGNRINSQKGIDKKSLQKSLQLSKSENDQQLKKQKGPYSIQLDENDSEKRSAKGEGNNSDSIEQIKINGNQEGTTSFQPAVHRIVSPLNVHRQQTDQQILEQAQEMTICAQPEQKTLIAENAEKSTTITAKQANLLRKAGTVDVGPNAKIEPGAGGGPTRLKPIQKFARKVNQLKLGLSTDNKISRKSWIKSAQENRFNRNDENPNKQRLGDGCKSLFDILNKKEKGPGYNDYRYKQQKEMFLNMTTQKTIETPFDIVHVLLNKQGDLAIAMSKSTMTNYAITIYNMEQNTTCFQFEFKGAYIKALEIQQNNKGTVFSVVYSDGFKFYMIIFDKIKIIQTLDINAIVNLNYQEVQSKNQAPMINSMFLQNDDIFVNLIQVSTMVNFHFIYSYKKEKIVQQKVATNMYFKIHNYPIGCFIDENRNTINVFFRRGELFMIKLKENRSELDLTQKPILKKITDGAFEMVFIHNNQIMITKTSKAIFFFKYEERETEEESNWVQYHKLKKPGEIYKEIGNWLTITDMDTGIEFYKFDTVENIPVLTNTVGNLYQCTNAIYRDDPECNLCLTYKIGQQDFQIETRKFQHANRVILDDMPHSDCISVDCKTMECFILAQKESLIIYQHENLKIVNRIKVNIAFNKQGIQNKILNVKLCQSERYLAVLVGHRLQNNQDNIKYLIIYEQDLENKNFLFKYVRILPQKLAAVGREIEFYNKNVNEILFTDYSQIFRYNHIRMEVQTYFDFSSNLNCQPEFVVFNHDQRIVMIASFYDVIWLNLDTKKEIDIDNDLKIGYIRRIFNHEKTFYILANKSNRKIGYFLIEFDEQDPKKSEPKFVINQKSNSDIGDANLQICQDQSDEGKKYLVVSSKTMKNNTFNVFVVELTSGNLIFRNEMFSLWESCVKGLLLASNEFIIMAEDGLSVLSLFPIHDYRIISDKNENKWRLRSIKSCNYLKVGETNHILIKEQSNNQERSISIQEQYEINGDTFFSDIYKIRIQNMTLVELMLFQSIFACRQQSDITKLIELQPLPKVFFKSFDEIDMSNMITILSYDSRPIKILLDDKNQNLFKPKYPLFYNYKHTDLRGDVKYQSAIDIALEANQIRAITLIIEYIIKYQNSHIFSYLFKSNLIKLINKGVRVAKLLCSDVFQHQFENDKWPVIHTNDKDAIELYNGSVFHIRDKYNEVFPYFEKEEQIQQKIKDTAAKVYKIKYTLNILPSIDEFEDSLMNACGETVEVEIFESKVIRDLIEFRWNKYAGKFHYIGLSIHTLYVILFNFYVSDFLQKEKLLPNESNKERIIQLTFLNLFMGICLIYPLMYDMTQMYKQGPKEYFLDFWNYIDQMHIWCGFTSIIIQIGTYKPHDPGNSYVGDVFLIVVTFLMLIKTFFYLRIFSSLSYIVTMMKKVFYDLRVFMYFYLILILMFSVILGILKVGNFKLSDDPKVQNIEQAKSFPNMEYRYLPYFLSNFLTVTRISLGDFDFSAPTLLDPFHNVVFWIVWYLITIMTCVVFLNFIIAEVSSSYESVKSDINGLIMKERALLIKESEDMMRQSEKKNPQLFPKYLIMREQEI